MTKQQRKIRERQNLVKMVSPAAVIPEMVSPKTAEILDQMIQEKKEELKKEQPKEKKAATVKRQVGRPKKQIT